MLVVDASVLAVALLDDAADGDAARARLHGERLAAPSLIDLDVLSVWRGPALGGHLGPRRAMLAMADPRSLPIHRVEPVIANSSFVQQEQKGMEPMPFSLFFAAPALAQVVLTVVNGRVVTRFGSRALIDLGLVLSAQPLALLPSGSSSSTPLLLTCAGFLVLMSVQGFIFGNSSAWAATEALHVASAASVLGVAQAVPSRCPPRWPAPGALRLRSP